MESVLHVFLQIRPGKEVSADHVQAAAIRFVRASIKAAVSIALDHYQLALLELEGGPLRGFLSPQNTRKLTCIVKPASGVQLPKLLEAAPRWCFNEFVMSTHASLGRSNTALVGSEAAIEKFYKFAEMITRIEAVVLPNRNTPEAEQAVAEALFKKLKADLDIEYARDDYSAVEQQAYEHRIRTARGYLRAIRWKSMSDSARIARLEDARQEFEFGRSVLEKMIAEQS
jgi:hypothetical protein